MSYPDLQQERLGLFGRRFVVSAHAVAWTAFSIRLNTLAILAITGLEVYNASVLRSLELPEAQETGAFHSLFFPAQCSSDHIKRSKGPSRCSIHSHWYRAYIGVHFCRARFSELRLVAQRTPVGASSSTDSGETTATFGSRLVPSLPPMCISSDVPTRHLSSL